MRTALNIQTAAPMAIVGLFAAAETSAELLTRFPGAAWAWELNIGLFGVFEAARAEPSPLRAFFHPASLSVSLAVLLLLAVARLARWRLLIAVAANLSFVATLALAFAASGIGRGDRSASLLGIGARPTSDLALVLAMLGLSLAGFLLSHVSYLRDCRRTGSA